MEYSLETIISQLPVKAVIGLRDKTIKQVVSADNNSFGKNDLTWISDRLQDRLRSLEGGVIIVSENVNKDRMNASTTYLVVDNPRLHFLKVLSVFFQKTKPPAVSDKACIARTVTVGKDVNIEPGVVIEDDCTIGEGSSIDCNTVIKQGTRIGNGVKIGANNTIGGVGFGYEKDEDGQYIVIPHIGNVVIEDGVEIGNNTTIDRAVLGSTLIRKNAKIDNLVHIAHGVEIGENSLIIANAMIAGSVVVGKNVWVAPSASVLNKKKIGDNALIGMGAVVLKDVANSTTVVGNPAKELPPKVAK
jgi:UDP-3-O-[3-hydroxymyristoyl] glucosamine N-acyltransferase